MTNKLKSNPILEKNDILFVFIEFFRNIKIFVTIILTKDLTVGASEE